MQRYPKLPNRKCCPKNFWIPSWELTYPLPRHFEDDIPFLQVGYVERVTCFFLPTHFDETYLREQKLVESRRKSWRKRSLGWKNIHQQNHQPKRLPLKNHPKTSQKTRLRNLSFFETNLWTIFNIQELINFVVAPPPRMFSSRLVWFWEPVEKCSTWKYGNHPGFSCGFSTPPNLFGFWSQWHIGGIWDKPFQLEVLTKKFRSPLGLLAGDLKPFFVLHHIRQKAFQK